MIKMNNNPIINIRDRILVNVSYQKEKNKKYENIKCNNYIMAKNAIYESNTMKVNGDFCLSTIEDFEITLNPSGVAIVIETPGYAETQSKFSTVPNGTPGQLSYIDGCSNSNLIDPWRNGDPCVNYLYIPPNTNQTFHTHPSIRVGIIMGGNGQCSLRNHDVDLTPNTVFVLERHEHHRFKTGNEPLWLMVFHPDSEDGPTDELNPMKTRTYIK
jgi:mannose-6-phosphate isomerase-like protein (cupin superfamily)